MYSVKIAVARITNTEPEEWEFITPLTTDFRLLNETTGQEALVNHEAGVFNIRISQPVLIPCS